MNFRSFRLTCLTLLLTAVCGRHIAAHGIPVQYHATDNTLAPNQQTYWGEEAHFEPVVLSGVNKLRFQAGLGIHSPADGIADGTTTSFDVTGAAHSSAGYSGQSLIYWDGTDVASSPVAVELRRSTFSLLVNPSDTFAPGLVIGDYNAAQADWHGTVNFYLPEDAPTGLYAVGFRVKSPSYATSDIFWVIGNNGLTNDQYAAGAAAILAAVPEPAGLSTIGVGLLLLGAAHWRRTRA